MGKGGYGTFGSGSCGPCGIDASTKDVLGQVSVGCQMAEDSMNQIMEHVDDGGMLKLINRCKMRHEELQADANDLLRKAGRRRRSRPWPEARSPGCPPRSRWL